MFCIYEIYQGVGNEVNNASFSSSCLKQKLWTELMGHHIISTTVSCYQTECGWQFSFSAVAQHFTTQSNCSYVKCASFFLKYDSPTAHSWNLLITRFVESCSSTSMSCKWTRLSERCYFHICVLPGSTQVPVRLGEKINQLECHAADKKCHGSFFDTLYIQKSMLLACHFILNISNLYKCKDIIVSTSTYGINWSS